MDSMQRWYEATKKRFSVRKYAAAPTEKQLAELEGMAQLLEAHGVRIAIGSSREVFKPIFLWYGKVTGTDAFAAIIAKKDTESEMVGYVGEAFILECTAMGLGTCWLGGSYSKTKAMASVTLGEDERIVCITPIGVPDEEYAERPRRSMEKLTDLSQQEFGTLAPWQKRALDCARKAPSAINRQPWFFRVEKDAIAVENTSANFGYGQLDCGIAMLHVELGAASCGIYGEWKRDEEDNPIFVRI